jgi:hypothetical protein
MDSTSTGRSRATRRIAVCLGLIACTIAALAAGALAKRDALPHLHATPVRVAPGGTVVLHGRGFPANAHIVLRATPPRGPSTRIGEAHSGLRGGFVAPIAIDAGAALGAYVAAACHDRCRVKATVHFRVVHR